MTPEQLAAVAATNAARKAHATAADAYWKICSHGEEGDLKKADKERDALWDALCEAEANGHRINSETLLKRLRREQSVHDAVDATDASLQKHIDARVAYDKATKELENGYNSESHLVELTVVEDIAKEDFETSRAAYREARRHERSVRLSTIIPF